MSGNGHRCRYTTFRSIVPYSRSCANAALPPSRSVGQSAHMLLACFAVGLVSGFAPPPRNRAEPLAEPRVVSRFARHAVCKPRASPRLCSADEASKNMLWDTIDKEERPRLIDVLEGRDYLTSFFLTHGVFVGGLNIVGEYGESHAVLTLTVTVAVAVALTLTRTRTRTLIRTLTRTRRELCGPSRRRRRRARLSERSVGLC